MRQTTFLSIILVVMLLLGCNEKTSDELLLEANDYIIANDNRAAVVTLKNAIILEPRNPKIRTLLGQIYVDMGFFVDAEKELRRALDLGVSEDIVTPLLVKAFYYQELLDQVIVTARNFKSEDKQARSKVDLYAYIAQLKTANQPNFDRELVTLDKLTGNDLLLAEAFNLYAEGKLQEALKGLNLRTGDEEKLETKLLEALIYSAQGDFIRSTQAFEKAIVLAPFNSIIKYQVAEVYINNDQLGEAEKYIDELLEINAQGAYANLLKAQITFKRDQYDVAFSSASTAIQNGLDRPLANLIAGISAYKLDNLESALQYLTKISKQLPANHYGNRVLVEIRLKLGVIDNIEELLESFTDNGDETSELFAVAAMSKFQQGNISDAIMFFEKSNKLTSNNAINLLREGLVKVSIGDYQGIESLKKAIKLDNTLDQAWALLTQAYMEKNDTESAFRIVKDWQKINELEGLNLEAYLHLQLGNNKEATEMLEKVIETKPEHFSALRSLMLLKAREKNFDEARQLAQRLVTLDKTDLQSYYALLNISIALKKDEEVEVQLLNDLDDSASTEQTMAIKTALGKLYNYQNKPMLTTKLGWDSSVLSNDDALTVLGDAYFILKDYPSAFKVYNSWLGQRLNNKTPWLKLLELLNQSRKYDTGLKASLKAAEIFKDNQDIETYLVIFQIKNGLIDAAKKQLTKIEQSNPNNPTLDLLYGELALKDDKLNEAKQRLTRYDTLYPSLNSGYLLAEVLLKQGKTSDAVIYLDTELERTPYKSIKDIHYVAELYSEYALYSNAAKHYQTLIELQDESMVTLNNYASVLIKLGNYEDALSMAYQALKMMPKSPYILDTVGWAAFKNGQIEESVTYLTNAYELLPTHPEVQLHFIEILIADGQLDKARLVISRCNPSNPKQQTQLELLKAMI
jgi:putative PEP-CTERM system TPR-repeat lipoprotein